MACTDGKNAYLNIKELPEITDIISGDFLIVETPTATSILDYDNFIITLDNTTFGDTIVSNTTNIAAVSSSVASLNTTLTSQISSLSSSFTSQISSLSASTARSNTFVTFSLPNYNSSTSPVILQQSNVSNVTLNTGTSAITVLFTTNFSNANYCMTTGITNATSVMLLNTLADTNSAVFQIRAAPQLSAFSTATKVSIQIINV
jgi:hypothetical protein